MKIVLCLLLGGFLAAQNGPPELANPDRDPFIPPRLERGPSAGTPRKPAVLSPEDVKRSREDLDRLVALTAEVRKAIGRGGQYTTDVPTARRLEEIEKLAKRMRKRMVR